MKKNLDFNRNPGGTNQHILRSDAELQKIIDNKPKNWTKKDFRGEGKLNSEKLLTRKETDRPGLIFYQKGKRINMKNILNHSTEESIQEFKKGEIDFSTLKNRSSTIKWRSNMSDKERELYDKKVYANLTEKQLEDKRERYIDIDVSTLRNVVEDFSDVQKANFKQAESGLQRKNLRLSRRYSILTLKFGRWISTTMKMLAQ